MVVHYITIYCNINIFDYTTLSHSKKDIYSQCSMQLYNNSYATDTYLYLTLPLAMDALKKCLHKAIKENLRTSLQKKKFLDWCWDWDYKEFYQADDSSEIDREQATYDYIYSVLSDSSIEHLFNVLMEDAFISVLKIWKQ